MHGDASPGTDRTGNAARTAPRVLRTSPTSPAHVHGHRRHALHVLTDLSPATGTLDCHASLSGLKEQ